MNESQYIVDLDDRPDLEEGSLRPSHDEWGRTPTTQHINYDQNPRVVVKDSPIHGRGVFARQDIPAFSYIGRYEGQMTDEDGMHVLWLYDEDRDDWVGVDGENEMRFLNHSEDPNAEWSDLDLYATRWISAGEEITFDYGWDDEEDPADRLLNGGEVDDHSVDPFASVTSDE